jgi:hypothetical protein
MFPWQRQPRPRLPLAPAARLRNVAATANQRGDIEVDIYTPSTTVAITADTPRARGAAAAAVALVALVREPATNRALTRLRQCVR